MKNKAPAEVQITAEQLLREAKERELELLPPPPKQKITDEEELNDYKLKKRKVCAHVSSSPLTACLDVNEQCEMRPKQLKFSNYNNITCPIHHILKSELCDQVIHIFQDSYSL